MRLQFFRISLLSSREDAVELNQFLASHRVLSIDRQFVADAGSSFWTVCVTWMEGDGAKSGSNTSPKDRGTIDYREVLPENEFRMFATLRTLRKEIAEKEDVPAYALFSNHQLAEMVRRRVTSSSQLSEIAGIGPARIEKYGERFLCELKKEIAADGPPEKGAADEANPRPT